MLLYLQNIVMWYGVTVTYYLCRRKVVAFSPVSVRLFISLSARFLKNYEHKIAHKMGTVKTQCTVKTLQRSIYTHLWHFTKYYHSRRIGTVLAHLILAESVEYEGLILFSGPQATDINRKAQLSLTNPRDAKSLHGLRESSGVVSCIASLLIDSMPTVSY